MKIQFFQNSPSKSIFNFLRDSLYHRDWLQMLKSSSELSWIKDDFSAVCFMDTPLVRIMNIPEKVKKICFKIWSKKLKLWVCYNNRTQYSCRQFSIPHLSPIFSFANFCRCLWTRLRYHTGRFDLNFSHIFKSITKFELLYKRRPKANIQVKCSVN